MAKDKKAPEAETKAETKVETRSDVEDMNAAAEASKDPYSRKPETKESTLDGGTKLEVYI